MLTTYDMILSYQHWSIFENDETFFIW
jgi:hypothetical protein